MKAEGGTNAIHILSKREVRGLVKFVSAVVYYSCHNLPATFLQPRAKKFSQFCIWLMFATVMFACPAAH